MVTQKVCDICGYGIGFGCMCRRHVVATLPIVVRGRYERTKPKKPKYKPPVKECLNCKKTKPIMCRNLCSRCFYSFPRDELNLRFPVLERRQKTEKQCLECGIVKVMCANGLCRKCYSHKYHQERK